MKGESYLSPAGNFYRIEKQWLIFEDTIDGCVIKISTFKVEEMDRIVKQVKVITRTLFTDLLAEVLKVAILNDFEIEERKAISDLSVSLMGRALREPTVATVRYFFNKTFKCSIINIEEYLPYLIEERKTLIQLLGGMASLVEKEIPEIETGIVHVEK